jgi:hypothetical protein
VYSREADTKDGGASFSFLRGVLTLERLAQHAQLKVEALLRSFGMEVVLPDAALYPVS